MDDDEVADVIAVMAAPIYAAFLGHALTNDFATEDLKWHREAMTAAIRHALELHKQVLQTEVDDSTAS